MTIKCTFESDDGRRIVVEFHQPAPIVAEGESVDQTPSSRPPPGAPGLVKCASCNVVPLRRTG